MTNSIHAKVVHRAGISVITRIRVVRVDAVGSWVANVVGTWIDVIAICVGEALKAVGVLGVGVSVAVVVQGVRAVFSDRQHLVFAVAPDVEQTLSLSR